MPYFSGKKQFLSDLLEKSGVFFWQTEQMSVFGRNFSVKYKFSSSLSESCMCIGNQHGALRTNGQLEKPRATSNFERLFTVTIA